MSLLLALVRCLAEQWVTKRKVARLVMAPDFLRELRAGYDATQQKQGESYHALIERYQTCDVLVFDDVGAEKLSDWVEEQFYLLVDDRYRQRLPELASSNCRKEALAQRLDRRVMDRLRETCAMVEVSGRISGIKRCSAENREGNGRASKWWRIGLLPLVHRNRPPESLSDRRSTLFLRLPEWIGNASQTVDDQRLDDEQHHRGHQDQ